jgi:hypothetical protein
MLGHLKDSGRWIVVSPGGVLPFGACVGVGPGILNTEEEREVRRATEKEVALSDEAPQAIFHTRRVEIEQ